MSDPGALYADTSVISKRLPASTETAVVALLIGDSNSGGNATLSAGLTTELTASPGVPLPSAYLYDKWSNGNRVLRADEVANTFIDMPADKGISSTLANPAYGLAHGLQLRCQQLTADLKTPRVYVIQLCSSFCSIGRATANANTSFAESIPTTAGLSTATLRELLTEYYARPAITDILATGRQTFLAGVYCLSMGADAGDPRQRIAGFSVTEPGLAAQYGPTAANLRDAIGARVGLTGAPYTLPMYWCEPPRVGQVIASGARLSLGVNREKMVASLREQHEYDEWFSFVEFKQPIARGTDQLHYTDRGLIELGRNATSAASKLLPLVEVTALP